MADAPQSSSQEADGAIEIRLLHQGHPVTAQFALGSTLQDLSEYVASELQIPLPNQKFLISPKPGLVKPPFPEATASIPLDTIASKKITLLGSTVAQVDSLNKAVASSAPRARYSGPLKVAKPSRTRDWKTVHDSMTYTFMAIKPLPYLPNPQRSQEFLERLANDPGIKASMARHKWSVGLLTEMNPIEHTTRESKTLGLNRNKGEVIELRLRTDSYDGYRDYKTIRKTLCHELAHNVFGEHDRNFWDLCHEIEREVERDDWKHGGHSVGNEEYYEPGGDDEIADHGAWTGGSYVLGTGETSEQVARVAVSDNPADRRAAIAKAAEERAKRPKDENK